MEEVLDIEPHDCVFYHPLCKLKEEEVRPECNEKILTRKNIKILTYNIFLRPPLIKNNQNDWKDERLDDFIKTLHNYDIICLQEMFGAFNSRKHKLIRKANKNGFFFYVDTSSPSFVSKYVVDGGLLILSRFPIISYTFMPYQYGVLSDSLSQKGLLYAKILIKDTFLHLFATHLQASYMDSGPTQFWASYETRMAQIEMVNNIMTEVLYSEFKKTDKILLLGDFNVDSNMYQYKMPHGVTLDDTIKKEYTEMLNLLNSNGIRTVDLFNLEAKGRPVTYGDYDEETKRKETTLTNPNDLGVRQSLDYIFECFYKETDNKNEEMVLKVDKKSLQVEKFLIDQNSSKGKKKYSQLSDHFGLSCELIHNGKVSEDLKEENLNEEQRILLDIL